MNINAIKALIAQYSLEELMGADHALANGEKTVLTVPGQDTGEQLTHVYAAIWIKKKLAEGNTLQQALRAFSQKIRSSLD